MEQRYQNPLGAILLDARKREPFSNALQRLFPVREDEPSKRIEQLLAKLETADKIDA